MLSPKDFVDRWGKDDRTWIRFPMKALKSLSILEADKTFLSQAGLPVSAAPFLNFTAPDSGELPTLAALWDLAEAFAAYREIGSDGGGNSIALDENNNGEVVLIDHDNDFSRQLVNTSIPQLAESLLAYRKLVNDMSDECRDDTVLGGKPSPSACKALRNELTRIDPAAMQAGCFWHNEVEMLEAEMD